jgi:hypothetical protein
MSGGRESIDSGAGEAEAEVVDDKVGTLLVDAVDLGRSNRTILRLLAISLAFDIVFSIGLGFMAVRAIVVSNEIKNEQLARCQKFNEQRQGELALWTPVLAQPITPLPANATPEQIEAFALNQRLRENFTNNLHKYFDPVKCDG